MDSKYKVFVWWGIGLAAVTTAVYFITKTPKNGSNTNPTPKGNNVTSTTTTSNTTTDPFEKQPITADNFNLNDLNDGHELSGVATTTSFLNNINFDFNGYFDSGCGCIQDEDGGEIQFRDVKKLVNVENGEVLFNYL
jgi:hypothetical protein